jgi:hypothetical protein
VGWAERPHVLLVSGGGALPMGGAIARALFAPCPKVLSLSSKATRRTGWLAKRAPI